MITEGTKMLSADDEPLTVEVVVINSDTTFFGKVIEPCGNFWIEQFRIEDWKDAKRV